MQTRYTSSAESAWFNTPASGVADDTRAAGHISGWNAITKRVFRRPLVCAAITALGTGSLPITSTKVPSALAAFEHAWKGVTAYSATITIFERKGSQTQNMAFDYRFSKPSNLAIRVVAGANKGATLVWDGGRTVVVKRGSGFLSLFRRTVSLDDPIVATIRGSTVDQLSFGAIIAHSRQAGTLSEKRGDVINGVATEAVVLIPAHPSADANLTREVIEISTTTHFPLRILGYAGPTLVRKIDIADAHFMH